MNLCFINPSISKRPEIYGLAKHLPKKYHITILQPSCRGMDAESVRLAENVNIEYVPSAIFNLSNSVVPIPFLNKLVDILLCLMKSKRCDLIHTCDYEYLTSIAPILVKRKYPVLTTIVTDALIGVNYSFASLLMDMLSRIYTFSIGKKMLENYDKIILLYSKLAEEANSLGLPMENIAIIPNGIDVKEIDDRRRSFNSARIREKYGLVENEKVILYVGRLVKMKRVEIILKVVEELVNDGVKVKALIVGDGPQRAVLEKMAYRVRRNVLFTGHLSDEKYECYNIADLFILPSLSEGLPTVLLEAASFCLPVVATNTHGIPEIVVHNKTGFLASKKSYNDYLIFARRLLTDEGLAREMGDNARKHVIRNFSWETIAKKCDKMYEELASNTHVKT